MVENKSNTGDVDVLLKNIDRQLLLKLLDSLIDEQGLNPGAATPEASAEPAANASVTEG